MNPFFESFNTPYNSIPFDKIQTAHYLPAIEEALTLAKEEVAQIANQTATPTFENTIVALEKSGSNLNLVTEVFFNLNSAETNEEMEEIALEISPKLAAYSNDILLNTQLFEKVKKVYDTQFNDASLNKEDKKLLEKTYKRFIRNGALLSETDKAQLREIDQELAALKVRFGQNVLQETNNYQLHLTNENDLDGLPDAVKQAAQEEAKSRNLEGWVFTLHYPSMGPFLQYAKNRALREKIYLASATKAYQENEQNNEAIIQKIVALRNKRAQLLGYDAYANFVLEERMAETPKNVFDFLNDLLNKAKPFAQKEVDELQVIAKNDDIDTLMPYDHAYYAEKLKQKKFALEEEKLRPYFPLTQVLNAAFQLAERLYGLKFKVRNDIPVYHADCTVYEIEENNEFKALLYADFFPRKGKRAGAWMTSFKGQYIDDSGNHRPHISIVCNFTPPTSSQPSLLNFTEVTTLFHEFGHALHGILANTKYESLSGTNVYWDFVELPSQFMENYCYEKEFLQSFAQNFETGAILPDEEIDKIVASANFMEGYQTLRQLSFALLDMAYHTHQLKEDERIEAFEKSITAPTRLYPNIDGTCFSAAFSHIFQGGYAAGYYSYKWAEVLDADAFSYFKEEGIFNPNIAQKFKELLSFGGTVNPMELYKSFRGRAPQPEALLKRAGLSN